MLRVKIPQGVLAARAGRGARRHRRRVFARLRPRHHAAEHAVPLRASWRASPRRCAKLDEVGLTTREACGDTVRNVTACALAGVCNGARLRRHAVRPGGHAPLSAQSDLPGAAAQVQDRALAAAATTARRAPSTTSRSWRAFEDSERGFEMSRRRRPVDLARGRAPARGVRARRSAAAGARGGGARLRSHRQPRRTSRARASSTSSASSAWTASASEYEAELAKLDADGRGRIAIDVAERGAPRRGAAPARRRCVRRPRRTDSSASTPATASSSGRRATTRCIARLERGDITSAQLRGAARLARQFGDGTVRLIERAEPGLPLRARGEPDRAARRAGRARARPRRRAHHPRRHLVPGRRHLQPGGDALARAGHRRRGRARRSDGRGRRGGQGGRVARHQDLGLPELVRPAPRRRARLPRHHAPRRRAGGARVSAPPRRRHRRATARPSDGRWSSCRRGACPTRWCACSSSIGGSAAEGEAPLAYFRRVEADVVKTAVADLAEFDAATAQARGVAGPRRRAPFKVAIGQGECAV